MSPKRMLVIENEQKWIDQVSAWFDPRGYEILPALTCEHGLELARSRHPDIIVLDFYFPKPGQQGDDALVALRMDKTTRDIPVVIYSIGGDNPEVRLAIHQLAAAHIITKGLAQGKKYELLELEAVVRHLLEEADKEKGTANVARISVGEDRLEIAPHYSKVCVNGKWNVLTRKEAQVLRYLDEHRGEPRSALQIAEACCNERNEPDELQARKAIGRLRKKTEPEPSHPTFILNHRNFGYLVTPGDTANGNTSVSHAEPKPSERASLESSKHRSSKRI